MFVILLILLISQILQKVKRGKSIGTNYTTEADKHKNAFDLDKLINRRRRPGLNEACEVYEVDVSEAGPVSEDEDILNYDDVDDPDAFV